MDVFTLLGIPVALYTIYATVTGKVIAKQGPGARVVSRGDSPRYFWVVVAIYGVLSIALMTVF